MARFEARPRITAEVLMVLTEAEARALDALIGYSADEFLKVFLEKMGKAYMEPHVDGFRSLCQSRGQLSAQLSLITDIQHVAAGHKRAAPASPTLTPRTPE